MNYALYHVTRLEERGGECTIRGDTNLIPNNEYTLHNNTSLSYFCDVRHSDHQHRLHVVTIILVTCTVFTRHAYSRCLILPKLNLQCMSEGFKFTIAFLSFQGIISISIPSQSINITPEHPPNFPSFPSSHILSHLPSHLLKLSPSPSHHQQVSPASSPRLYSSSCHLPSPVPPQP